MPAHTAVTCPFSRRFAQIVTLFKKHCCNPHRTPQSQFAIGWWVWIDAWVKGKIDGTIPSYIPPTSTQYAGNTSAANTTANAAALAVQTSFDSCWTLGVICSFGGMLYVYARDRNLKVYSPRASVHPNSKPHA